MISEQAQTRFDNLYERLVLNDVQTQIGVGGNPRQSIGNADLSFLLSVASRLALDSEDTGPTGAQKRLQAYEIVTRLLGFSTQAPKQVRDAASLVLARLGNFPARDLLNTTSPSDAAALPPYLAIEALAREIENTVQLRGERGLVLTDFQVRMLTALERSRAVSISAPTSAGKSFALSIDVVRRLVQGKPLTIVYVVPTRALIRQVMFETIVKLNEYQLQDIPVLCVPEPLTTKNAPRGAVYVLTQERLHTLLYAPEPLDQVDVLIVDEAQEIVDRRRGLTLETVIDRTLKRYPKAAVFFSSPLRSNPGYLLTLFGRDQGEFFVERTAPVSQTLIHVRPIDRKPRRALIEVNVQDAVVKAAEIDLPFDFRGPSLPYVALKLTRPDETSIIYANGPSSAEKYAETLAAEMADSSAPESVEVRDLVSFIREHIHPKYLLADCLERGVGFHYGKMPQIVRSRVEDLLKKRMLRFVCCTSTLLQGVNLPAKHIFIEDPKKGPGNPMKSGDFWNLAGRAGRLAKEFNGNVWCVYGKAWDSDPFKGDKFDEMKSSFDTTLLEEPEKVLSVIEAPDQPSEARETQRYEQVFGRAFVDYHLAGKPLPDTSALPADKREIVEKIKQHCAAFASVATLPTEVFARNTTVSPLKLDELAKFLRAQPVLRGWVPRRPMLPGSYETMRTIFQKLDQIFFRTGKNSYLYSTWLANQWMGGASLKDLIAGKLKWDHVPDDPHEISKTIRKLFEELETTLRYQYVKYLRAYNDVLRAVLELRGESKLAEAMAPLHLLIEYGAFDETLISLMSLGMSRTSAILLKSALRWPDQLTRPQCQARINTLNTNALNLPIVCRDEIVSIRRG